MPTATFLLLFTLLLCLAWWQWERGEDKAASWAEFDSAAAEQAVKLASAQIARIDSMATFQRVTLTGNYDGAHQFLLDNRPEQGQPGFHVLTPFRVEGGNTIVMVDRGWLAGNPAESPDVSVAGRKRDITGRLADLPQPGLDLGPGEGASAWPRVMQFPDIDDIRAQLAAVDIDANVAPRIIWLDQSANDGFKRNWSPGGMRPERHFAYSFQWLALALTLLIIYFVMLRRWLRSAKDSRGKLAS